MASLRWLVGDAPSRHAPLTRSERLIAGGRVVLAAVAVAAIWIDPHQLARHYPLAHGAITGYLAYALAVAALVARPPAAPRWLPLATQAVDLVTLPVLLILTRGLASPFFLYFLFPLLTATLRWHWRGTLWSSVAAAFMFLVTAAWARIALPIEPLDPVRFLIRVSLLGVMAALLGALGAHEQVLRARLVRLAHGPKSIALYTDELARDTLRHAAILEAPRVVMTWEESEQPWLNVASSAGGEVAVAREAPATWEPLVAEPLSAAGFLCEDAAAVAAAVDRETPSGFERWIGSPLHPGFRDRFAVRSVLSVPMHGAQTDGRLFWLDRPGLTADDLALGQIVAGQITPLLDQVVLQQRLREAAVAHERVRLARDLHDGLLQSLTAIALQVEAARDAVNAQPEAVRERLSGIQTALAEEQRSLRLFIRQMKPSSPREDVGATLCQRVRALADRVERELGLAVRVRDEGMRAAFGPTLEQQAYLMVHEALMNAARHAGASAVTVELATVDSRLSIVVEDDGHGFGFRGRRDSEDLAATGEEPRSLREGVAMLGGEIVVVSSERGARVEILVPGRARKA